MRYFRRILGTVVLLPFSVSAQVYQPLDLGHIYQQAEQIKALRAQQELMAAEAEASRQRTAERQERQERREDAVAESQSASDVRFLKFIDQANACQRVYTTEADRSTCIDKLKLTDPDFAKTWIEAMTPGAESPELHAHRAQLLKTYLLSQSAQTATK